jgi:thiol-disulfide isomerase/thioredoxin
VCMDEINSLPLNAPYESFSLVENVARGMMDAGRAAEGRAFLESYRSKLQAALAEHEKAVPAGSTARAGDEIAERFGSLIGNLSSFESQYDLVGKPAPAFTFIHVFNADSTLTLAKLKGKVVMIDFWATWCAPCIISFAEARKLYDEFKDRGFVILGVTSFQGMYRDRAAGISEGTREKPLDPQREIELTSDFLTKHGMVWPVAFSNRSVFDPSYSIRGIPTFVLVDRKGVVRYFQVGIGGDTAKRRIIEDLLAG